MENEEMNQDKEKKNLLDGLKNMNEQQENASKKEVPANPEKEAIQDVSAPTESQSFMQNSLNVSKVQNMALTLKNEVNKIIVGQEEMLDQMIIAMLSDGHILLEGVPGIAKTLAAKMLSNTIDIDFSRIQFTPDLMPTDVLGTSVFNMKNSEFSFKKGPIFSNIVLIDEINRSPAKTQSALFEVMEEQQVTIDGKTYKMQAPFLVIATQNPVEQEGTYKLPEAQLDRFLFKIRLEYPNTTEEIQILKKFRNDFKQTQTSSVKAVVSAEDIAACKEIIEKVHIKDELIEYIAKIVNYTRNNGDLFLGASPRASLAIMNTAKTHAAVNGRDFVTPDDIRAMCFPVLNHRIILNPDKEMEGIIEDDVINEIIEKIEVPR
ncbi:MAG: AAA family ATPase [Chitinophagales bacterium]